jgi:hypothetical protein
MSAPDDSHEITILESKGIQIKNHYYRIVLTSRRIIFDSASDNVHRSIPLSFIRGVEPGTDYSGDPVITVSALSARGEEKNVILRFSQSDFPDPQQMRSHWYSEIRERIEQPPQVLPDITPGNVPPATVFCTKCGKKLVESSVFCDRCGAEILHTVKPAPPEQRDDRIQEQVMRPAVSTGETGRPRKEQSFAFTGDPGTGKTALATASPPRGRWKKRSFFSDFPPKKSAFIIGACLAVVIIAAAVFLIVFPAGVPAFNLTSPGMNITFPDLSAVALPSSPDGNTGTNAENPGSAANPEEPSIPVVTPSRPALTFAPGDPGAVLATYPSLFNNGDGAGLRDLLSENVQSHYSLDTLNKDLATARSKGYSIEKIHVTNQIIEEDSATLDADIYWNTAGSSLTPSPKPYLAYELYLVYENNQWKLDSLILSP